jgi:hypothetical protein
MMKRGKTTAGPEEIWRCVRAMVLVCACPPCIYVLLLHLGSHFFFDGDGFLTRDSASLSLSSWGRVLETPSYSLVLCYIYMYETSFFSSFSSSDDELGISNRRS